MCLPQKLLDASRWIVESIDRPGRLIQHLVQGALFILVFCCVEIPRRVVALSTHWWTSVMKRIQNSLSCEKPIMMQMAFPSCTGNAGESRRVQVRQKIAGDMMAIVNRDWRFVAGDMMAIELQGI